MNGIPVMVEINSMDMEVLNELFEAEEEGSMVKDFSEKMLKSISASSKELKSIINAVDGQNPYCMDNIKT